ncbi:hypothetical protein HJC23_008134, partial [Cyclotella cryptica]
TLANDNAVNGSASNNVINSDNAYASNDNELVENPAVSNTLSVATHQSKDRYHRGNANKDAKHSAQILQQLGIRHLDDKLTRPRLSQETDEHILREAGVALYHFNRQDDDEDDDNNNFTQDERESAEKTNLRTLTARKAQILREAGVKWMDHMNIDPCHTATTVGATATDSYVTAEHSSRDHTGLQGGLNNTYAEKELLRRLKNGWVSTGIDCHECGMPIICQKEGGEGLMECIILWGGGVLSSNDPTIIIGHDAYCPSCEENMIMKCKSDLASQDDDALKKELGRRIFSGWTLLSLSCPSCNLPLISEGKNGPSICLRCG